MVEPIVRELIDRIIDTGQVQYEDRRRNNPRKDYEIVWNYPVIMSEQSQAQADFLKARRLSELSNIYTVNELREMEGLGKIDEGDVVLGILKGQKTVPFQTNRPTNEERRPSEATEEEVREE